MQPPQLAAESFAGYPAEARRIAVSQIGLLRRLPLSFVPLLLRELIVYDWKFPAERMDLDRQFRYLGSLKQDQLARILSPFVQLRLPGTLEKTDWVNAPGVFTEQLTAHLWTTHQIDAFRAAAVDYVARANAGEAEASLRTHRLGIAIIGQGVQSTPYRLFRKLRAHGTYFTRVKTAGSVEMATKAVSNRAKAHPEPYGHWYIDGGESTGSAPGSVTHISYAALAPARTALQGRMQKIYEASVFDPEAFRTTMAQLRPDEIGLASGGDSVLNRFQLSLLAEGSGTQVFATTFVQWAAREALRRAQPLTLLARFAPRQRENPMNVLLSEAQRPPELDPQGSLIDADMGAYYTWLNQQRLPGAEQATFLGWFEDHQEAVAIGPSFDRGKESDAPIPLRDLLSRVE